MSFKSDCEATPGLAGTTQTGLKALRQPDRAHITKKRGTALTTSIDLDAALRDAMPNDPRWDYGIAQKSGDGEAVQWVEVHPASGGANLTEMQNKLAWLKRWMAGTPLTAYPREFIWVASGKSAFTTRDPKIKALAAQGLRFAGGHLEL